MIQWVTTHRISPVRIGWKATKGIVREKQA